MSHILFLLFILSFFCNANSLFSQQKKYVLKVRKKIISDSSAIKVESVPNLYYVVQESPSDALHVYLEEGQNTLWLFCEGIRDDSLSLRAPYGDAHITSELAAYTVVAQRVFKRFWPIPLRYKARPYDLQACFEDLSCRRNERAFRGTGIDNIVVKKSYRIQLLRAQDSLVLQVYRHRASGDSVQIGLFKPRVYSVYPTALAQPFVLRPFRADTLHLSLTVKEILHWRPFETAVPRDYDAEAALLDNSIIGHSVRIARTGRRRSKTLFEGNFQGNRLHARTLAVVRRLRAGDALYIYGLRSRLCAYYPVVRVQIKGA